MDENSNTFPAVYSRLIASNPIGMNIGTQHALFYQAMRRETGETELVHNSAYLTKSLAPRPEIYVNHLNSLIMCWSHVRDVMMAESTLWSLAREKYTLAFVWDIDDITLLSKRHMAEISYLEPSINSMSLHRLVQRVLTSVDLPQSEEIESGSVVNIDDEATSKYSALIDLYNEVSSLTRTKKSIISHDLLEKCGMIDEEVELCETAAKCQEIHNQRWKRAKKCMNIVNRRSAKSKDQEYVNIVITKDGVANAAAKLLVSGQSSAIPIENIYSTHDEVKPVWERIQRRFGHQCIYVYLTSRRRFGFERGWMDIQITGIAASEAFDIIYKGQRDHLLK